MGFTTGQGTRRRISMQKTLIAAVVAGMAALALSQPAFTAGGGGGSDDTAENCKQGEVWNKDTQKCEKASRGSHSDDMLFEAGQSLAKAGRYGEAITILSLAADKSDPRILNYLGYSHRMAGRVLVGLGYYQEALRANPDYVLVREYMGEAHLQLGDVEAARVQLGEIEKRAGKNSAEYAELSARIDAYLKG
jgi:tetratricopeptide (TPR) repeat protein